jgi:hypothetical protein
MRAEIDDNIASGEVCGRVVASVGGGTDVTGHFTGHAGDGLAHATLGAVEEDLERHGVRPSGRRPGGEEGLATRRTERAERRPDLFRTDDASPTIANFTGAGLDSMKSVLNTG